MKKILAFLIISIASIASAFGQSYKQWDSEDIIKFYKKNSTESSYYSNNNKKIEPASMKEGVYEVIIADPFEDYVNQLGYEYRLYEIKGTDYYVSFRTYVGYWGYRGKPGILEVGSYNRTSKFYIKP